MGATIFILQTIGLRDNNMQFISKGWEMGLERWGSSLEHMILLEFTWIQFLAPMLRGSQLPATPGDPMPMTTRTHMAYIHAYTNK